ncbi:MAG: crotonase/enoyl-CoA hydratase family protein [Myxococcales bacterium]|nr:crotonase/enoyl-CoA hydratase family protein [Myxococcales bacterium]
MSQRVLTELRGSIATVRLNRAEKRNGLDLPMFEAILEAGEALRADPRVRVVILSGEGKAFCAGLDFQAFLALGNEGMQRMLARGEGSAANVAQRVAWIWRELPMPVIAAVHGACFGGGLQIALGADIRLVAKNAELSVMEIVYGLIPDMSLSQTLLDLVRLDVAKELTFTGRIVGAEEAVRLGLATRVSEDPLEEATTLAEQIAARSPDAIRAAKRLLNEAPRLAHKAALELETELQLGLLGTANQLEAVQARFEKRSGRFTDPRGA